MQFDQLGPYRIVRLLGRGGMGAVYEGADVSARERVAIKVLHPQFSMAEGFRERFEAEIDSLKKLRHENIVRLFGYGEQDGVLFYSMELVDGNNLEHALRAGGCFDWRRVVRISIVVAKALKHAHDMGVIHRDIKPGNLLIDAQDNVKLADFGIARLFGSNQLTSASGVLGTLEYMSPEQAEGRQVTDRCDQYSLGGVMYALLAGRPPFMSSSMPKMIHLQRYETPDSVRSYAPDVPRELERIIMQMLEKEPGQRFANMGVLSRQLEAMEKALSRPADDDFEVGSGQTFDHSAASLELGETVDSEGDYDSSESVDMNQGDVDSAEADASAWDSIHAPTGIHSRDQPVAEDDVAVGVHPTKFTTVEEDAHRERLLAEQAVGPRWWQLAGLVSGLVLLLLAGWYFTRPPTADSLYARIRAVAENGEAQQLASAEHQMREFIERFADDPRAAEVVGYQKEVELYRMERRLRIQARMGRGTTGLMPIEQIYVEAVRVSETDPLRAVEQFDALIDLYGEPGDESNSEGDNDRRQLCLKLARQQRELLQAQANEMVVEQRGALEERLARADSIVEDDPARAEKIWKAIVDLYGDRPWADDLVAQAQKGLARVSENGR